MCNETPVRTQDTVETLARIKSFFLSFSFSFDSFVKLIKFIAAGATNHLLCIDLRRSLDLLLHIGSLNHLLEVLGTNRADVELGARNKSVER